MLVELQQETNEEIVDTTPIIILGCGGHAKVVIDLLKSCGRVVKGFTSPDSDPAGTALELDRLGTDSVVAAENPDLVELAIGFGSIGVCDRRKILFENFYNKGFIFPALRHPSAIVSVDAKILDGAQIMAGSVIQPGAWLGKNCIVNTASSVDHDTVVGDHCHLAPGVTCSGGVTLGEGCHIGTGATLIEGISIGRNTMVAAGAVVIGDLPSGVRVKGIPARPF